MDPIHDLIVRYFNLAFMLSDHLPDYIDTYFGPMEWIIPEEVRKDETISSLKDRSEALLQDVNDVDGLEEQRKSFLLAHIEAMHMATRILNGEEMSLEEKVDGLFNVIPSKTPESEFFNLHKTLDDLLPPGGSLQERMSKNHDSLTVPNEKLGPLFEGIAVDLRRWTKDQFVLPQNERYELKFVTDEAWIGFSEYKGNGFSNIEVNTSIPFSILFALDFLAHEIYPGHHTESAIKETELIHGQGRNELNIILLLSPAAVTSEGIAMHARDILLGDDEIIQWLDNKILPLAGLEHLDAQRQLAIENAWRSLRGVRPNAVFMHSVDGETDEHIKEYCLEYSLEPEEYVDTFVDKWLKHPVLNLYTFNYLHGYTLLESLFRRTGDAKHWFGKLLSGTYLPREIEEILAE